jgi:hypothetical protein
MRGHPELGGFLLTRGLLGQLANGALGMFGFVLTDRRCNATDTEVVSLAEVLSDSVQLVNDGVSAFHRELRVLLRSLEKSYQFLATEPGLSQ